MAKAQKGRGFSVNGHKRFSASNSKRWINCNGCIALIESLPLSEQVSGDSIHSRRGTCAHAVGEMCLIAYHNDKDTATCAEDYLGMEVEGVLVDQDIVDAVNVYLDWAKPLLDTADLVSIEESLSLFDFITAVQGDTGDFLGIDGHEHGGTGDFIVGQLFGPLIVGDYKNGKGIVVMVEDNPQLLIYALAALAKYLEEYDFDEVRLVIVQPNAHHSDGPIREWVVSPEFVFEWANTVMLPAAERCMDAAKALKRGDEDFVEKYLNASEEWCDFCPARARCAAAMNLASDNAVIEFTEILADDTLSWESDECENFGLTVHVPNPALITVEQEAAILLHGEAIIGFVHAIQERAKLRAERGEKVAGFKLVESTTRRRFKGSEADRKTALKRMGLHPHDYMENPPLKSIAQLEKVFKAKGVNPDTVKKFIAEFVEKPVGANKLVSVDAPGKPVQAAIDAEFEHLYDGADDALEL